MHTVSVIDHFEEFDETAGVKAGGDAQSMAVTLEIVPLVDIDACNEVGGVLAVACVRHPTAAFFSRPTIAFVGDNLIQKPLRQRPTTIFTGADITML